MKNGRELLKEYFEIVEKKGKILTQPLDN